MRFARWVFLLAGLFGVLFMIPLYFLEHKTSEDYPPPITHPEYYYGFVGVTLAWQLLFLVIASDPVRYRLAMLPAMVGKVSCVVAIGVLYALGRAPAVQLVFASADATWLVLFLASYLLTPREKPSGA